MAFASFMASPTGRILRVVIGLAVIGVGAWVLAATAGNTILALVLIVVGLLPTVAGLFDFCVFAPLFGAPLGGKAIRAHQRHA